MMGSIHMARCTVLCLYTYTCFCMYMYDTKLIVCGEKCMCHCVFSLYRNIAVPSDNKILSHSKNQQVSTILLSTSTCTVGSEMYWIRNIVSMPSTGDNAEMGLGYTFPIDRSEVNKFQEFQLAHIHAAYSHTFLINLQLRALMVCVCLWHWYCIWLRGASLACWVRCSAFGSGVQSLSVA